MNKMPSIIEYLIECGENMVPINLGSLLNELKYDTLKKRVINNEWEYTEDVIFGPCTKGFVIAIDHYHYEDKYRIIFVDYNDPGNKHLVNIKDNILIVEVISLNSDKRNMFINRKYYYEPFENDYTIEIKEKIQS